MNFASAKALLVLALAVILCKTYLALTHNKAKARLMLSGIRVAGKCSDKRNPDCTSLQGIKATTIKGLQAIRKRSKCPILVTGGTEAGHVNRTKRSHWNGYKADIKPNSCISSFIQKSFKRIGNRSDDGAPQYRSPGNHIFAREENQWDILY
ncbi:uncharacterized protein LOC118436973 [Folsomia candida]|uniref:uncharacterized protein LOC118436973 n=1 Tax=Folsomia candida TaxID=158441 RepID=UPI001604E159|nr:uncharacterized protein LOC118436973 [Folsomia candida]